MTDFSQLGIGAWIAIGVLVVLQLTLQVLAVIDLAKKPGPWTGRKLVWLLVVLLGEMLGVLVYFAYGKGTFPLAGRAEAAAATLEAAQSAVDKLYGTPSGPGA